MTKNPTVKLGKVSRTIQEVYETKEEAIEVLELLIEAYKNPKHVWRKRVKES